MKGLICPKKSYAFEVIFCIEWYIYFINENDREFFCLRNKIEENVAQHHIYGCGAKKNHKDTSFEMGVVSKMDRKNVKKFF